MIETQICDEALILKLSIVTTLYRSAATIDAFYRRIMTAAEAITPDIELIFVNDGSPDDSLERALALHHDDVRVVVIDLARNAGHHKAMMTGLAHARGDLVFLIDSDLEEEPELLTRCFTRFQTGDCDVVYGVQQKRRGGWFEQATGNLFFAITRLISDQHIPRNLTTVRLMTRAYVRALVRHRDREFMIGHLWEVTGFRRVPILITKHKTSPTTYSFARRVEMAVKYLTVTSTRLLYAVFYTGVSIFVLSLAVIAYYLYSYFVSGISISGFASLILSIWFFGGLTTLILGVLGIYLANILAEVKRRPYAIIRKIHRGLPHVAASADLSEP